MMRPVRLARVLGVMVLAGTLAACTSAETARSSTVPKKAVTELSRPPVGCQPLRTFPEPPPGFNPVTGTAAQLQEYGFPPRPPVNNAGALAAWSSAMEKVKSVSPPDPVCSNVTH